MNSSGLGTRIPVSDYMIQQVPTPGAVCLLLRTGSKSSLLLRAAVFWRLKSALLVTTCGNSICLIVTHTKATQLT